MIHTLLMLGFWGLMLPFAALIGFPWTLITRNVSFLYWMGMRGSALGVRIAGVRPNIIGLDRFDHSKTYIFMSNHTSNIDPPLLLPIIPRRTSVMVKKELFNYPLLGRLMLFGDLIPVDRGNRESGIASVRAAAKVLAQGVNMTIYVEGKRSFDGRLLAFKKGPFYLAQECQVPIVPVTIVGTNEAWPKGVFAIHPQEVSVIFHDPIPPEEFGDRESLIARVRKTIDSGLPPELQEASQP